MKSGEFSLVSSSFFLVCSPSVAELDPVSSETTKGLDAPLVG
jgi:hypothetical protein